MCYQNIRRNYGKKSCDVVNYKKDFKESHFIRINLILFLIILSFKNLDGAY